MKPFSSEIGIQDNVPISDGATAYYFQYSHQTYILMIRNALYIQDMHNNLTSLFLMRAGGVIVKDIPKTHCKNPTSSDQCILFESNNLNIPLKLSRTFS